MKKTFSDYLEQLYTLFSKFTYEIYLIISTGISGILTNYYKIDYALYCFLIVTSLDTITRINANALEKQLKFNPFRKYFWREIKSDGFREMLKKIFAEYGIYLIICFVVDKYVLDHINIRVLSQDLSLPVVALYLFSAIEIWSIGENIDDAGGINLFKRVLHLFPEKFQKIFINEKEN